MILIDTNVFSELVKPRPEACVVDWLFQHRRETLLSTIVIAELSVGIRTTRGQAKRALLFPWLNRLIERHEGRIAQFDVEAAKSWGELASSLILTGERSGHFDSMLAAQGLALGVPIATRNIRDFERSGVSLIDPWAA
ncbi:MAG: PIN domain-containing protein [Sphingomonadaceae bacterium]|nr:PIN domain-containing protein [Sphingomonadaceae bacterium]